MDEAVAVITLNSQNTSIVDVSLAEKPLRFTCTRCASLCCRLGGPIITKKEAQSIENTGLPVADFLVPLKSGVNCSSSVFGCLKSRNDGSCVFLERNKTKNSNSCNIYSVRPALCRLYPFTFEKVDSDKVVLKINPCCLGLNSSGGELVTKQYILDKVAEPLLEAVGLLNEDGSF